MKTINNAQHGPYLHVPNVRNNDLTCRGDEQNYLICSNYAVLKVEYIYLKYIPNECHILSQTICGN